MQYVLIIIIFFFSLALHFHIILTSFFIFLYTNQDAVLIKFWETGMHLTCIIYEAFIFVNLYIQISLHRNIHIDLL